MRKIFLQVLSALLLFPSLATAQTEPAFPQCNGVVLNYNHYDDSGTFDSSCSIELRNVTGENANGSLEMVYHCFDRNGKPYYDAPNECLIKVNRVSSKTFISMDKMAKVMKMMNMIPAGDVSSIFVPLKVGDKIADSEIITTLGPFKTFLSITDRKVLDHKTINIDGRSFECWLVHEKIVTRTPFGTDTATADTWYAKGAGCISQDTYDAKGKLKGSLELTSVR